MHHQAQQEVMHKTVLCEEYNGHLEPSCAQSCKRPLCCPVRAAQKHRPTQKLHLNIVLYHRRCSGTTGMSGDACHDMLCLVGMSVAMQVLNLGVCAHVAQITFSICKPRVIASTLQLPAKTMQPAVQHAILKLLHLHLQQVQVTKTPRRTLQYMLCNGSSEYITRRCSAC